jgi:hypothetical protein
VESETRLTFAATIKSNFDLNQGPSLFVGLSNRYGRCVPLLTVCGFRRSAPIHLQIDRSVQFVFPAPFVRPGISVGLHPILDGVR